MSETKTEYVVEWRRAKDVPWRESMRFKSKSDAERHMDKESKRWMTYQHRLIRVTVLKESK